MVLIPALSTKPAEVLSRYATLGGLVLLPFELTQQPGFQSSLFHQAEVFLTHVPLTTMETAHALLDSGAVLALFTMPNISTLEEDVQVISYLPRSRIGVILPINASTTPSTLQEALVNHIQPSCSWLCLTWEGDGDGLSSLSALAQGLKGVRGKEGSGDYVEILLDLCGVKLTTEEVQAFHKQSIHVTIPQSSSTLPPPPSTDVAVEGGAPLLPLDGGLDFVDAFIACIRTDRADGLYSTVVVDECGMALGLVYSSTQSIRASVACGRGVYYSRSRGGLWRKGDTSGAWQELVSIDVDCDGDALRFIVRQKGDPAAFCHLNRRNCWKSDKGLGALQRTLQSRKQQAPEGSYTKRLFDDSDLLRKKLLEEAQELIEAETQDEIASEAADVIYFAMVRCAAADVTLESIESHLNRRHYKLNRRPGNAKAYRVAAAEAVLGGGSSSSSTTTSSS